MTARCAVLGDPIEHSLSPVLHRAGYAALGVHGFEYGAVRVPSGGLPAFLEGLEGREDDWRGLSLTMPLKRELLALCHQRGWAVSPTARAAGGANTLVREESGAWRADNTDVPGAMHALRERYEGSASRLTILGAGATAASIGLAAVGLGCSEITLAVRSPERAVETIDVLTAYDPSLRLRTVVLDAPTDSDLLVSTVPAAAQTPEVVAAHTASCVFEVVYDPWPTPVAAAARERGGVLVTGLDLLVHQAVLQFEQFTPAAPDSRTTQDSRAALIHAMRTAGESALHPR
ncbi:shikimate dehydrogenase [Nocardioides acrostichi]|uniref:Shikimate dehydrogenase n=1 Tax=Nocardioides acrostichi TaxID=2784339 RepID=A0A930V1J0_9ACTN|nr:shikimate dehydrogenase [Nocardioides acrostichi]MBF4162181.1 shikimate dehydrogenase [Nocardioides acrostichi]